MIRRMFLKCCVSAALAVGTFYGGMGIPQPPVSDWDRGWGLIQTHLPSLVREMVKSDDDPVWKIIQNFDQGVRVFPPYSTEDALLCRKVFGV